MKQIQLSRHFWEGTFQPALLQWKAGKTRQKVLDIVCDLIALQRKEGVFGHKHLINERCIQVSSDDLKGLFHDCASRTKFSKWVISTGLVIKDRSWVSKALSNARNIKCRPDSWHFNDPQGGERITVEYDDSKGLFGVYSAEIKNAEGMKVKTDVFHGVWASEDYRSGNLSWGDLKEVRRCARNLIKGNAKVEGFRVFDAITECKKDLRPKCFLSQSGEECAEIFDIPGAATFTSTLAAAALGYTSVTDKDVVRFTNHLRNRDRVDPYEQIFNGIKAIDPRTNCYRKWDKATRDTLKMDFQCVTNCNFDYMWACRKSYSAFWDKATRAKAKPNNRRQWLVLKSIGKINRPLYESILRTKLKGKETREKDYFYRLHTMGEKMIMEELLEAFTKAGFCVHRVHDALWTTDLRLKSLSKEQMGQVVGDILFKVFDQKDYADYSRNGINRLKACITKEGEEWAREGMCLSAEDEADLKNALKTTTK